jgi:uncharacterized protein YdcH (DUF465 family)
MKKKNRRKPTYRHPRHYLSKLKEKDNHGDSLSDSEKIAGLEHRIRELQQDNDQLVGKVAGLESAIAIIRSS